MYCDDCAAAGRQTRPASTQDEPGLGSPAFGRGSPPRRLAVVGGRGVALYRHRLPQLDGTPFLTDGGLETSLVFLEGVDLPAFAAFPLLAGEEGRRRLRRYFEPYLRLAAGRGTGFVLDTATWRANADWGEKLGYGAAALADAN